MRRRYAFEAEGVSEEVKSQLEKVEDTVDAKCDSAEACDKILDKIDSEQSKFNAALKDMASAAKDCKDGECDKAEMAEKISPKMAELKEVAKSIGVASEADTLTEKELQDAKAYLEGAKEIVESKKDEIDSGDSSSEKSDDADSDEEEADEDDDEEADKADESYIDELDAAIESYYLNVAMEGANVDAVAIAVKQKIQALKPIRKEMKAAVKAKDWDTASAKAKECSAACDNLMTALNDLTPSVKSAMIVRIGLMVAALAAAATIGAVAAPGALQGARTAKNYATLRKGATAASGASGIARRTHLALANNMAKTAGELGRGKVRAIGAGAAAGAAGAGIGGTAVVSLLKKKKVVDDEGKIVGAENETQEIVNPLIMAMKADVRATKKHYDKLAAKYAKKKGDSSDEAASEAYYEMADTDFAACESFIEDMDAAIESEFLADAMEGANVDSVVMSVKKTIQMFKGPRGEMRKAVKAKDYKTAAEKARECADAAGELASELNGLNDSVSSAVLVNLAIMVAVAAIGMGLGAHRAGKFKTVQAGAFNDQINKARATAAKSFSDPKRADAAVAGFVKAKSEQAAKLAKATTKHNVISGTAIGAGVGTVGIGSSAVVQLLTKRKVVDENGEVEAKKLGANDFNPLIMAMKADARAMKNHYTKLAAKFDKEASSASADAVVESYLDEGSAAYELFGRPSKQNRADVANMDDDGRIGAAIRYLAEKHGGKYDSSEEAKTKVHDAVDAYNEHMRTTGNASDDEKSTKLVVKSIGGLTVAALYAGDELIEIQIPVTGKHKMAAFNTREIKAAAQKALRNDDRAARKAAKNGGDEAPADESYGEDFYNGFIQACESNMIDQVPYLFD